MYKKMVWWNKMCKIIGEVERNEQKNCVVEQNELKNGVVEQNEQNKWSGEAKCVK